MAIIRMNNNIIINTNYIEYAEEKKVNGEYKVEVHMHNGECIELWNKRLVHFLGQVNNVY